MVIVTMTVSMVIVTIMMTVTMVIVTMVMQLPLSGPMAKRMCQDWLRL